MSSHIGINMKKIRVQSNLTQQNVADICGLSKAMISKIESGKAMPAVATLSRIAQALGVKVSLLMEEGGNRDTVFQNIELPPGSFTSTDPGYRFCALASEYADKLIQPMVLYAKNGEVHSHRVAHPGEECVYIVEGGMHFLVGDAEYSLKQGDFLYFDALQPHGIDSVEDEVRFLNFLSGNEYVGRKFIANPAE